ncbi:MAG: ThuA domain-containing protein [Pirellulaceae bacterium]|jgi:putative heme-binding domain-containing protein|nr:ThuA domain-containing protein [Pirellulaceae bacterium]
MKQLALAMIVVFLSSVGLAFGQTPSWADPELRVRQGMLLWLDAQRIGQARSDLDLPTLKDGELLDDWQDASGNHRDCIQRNRENQPKLVQIDDAWVVRFDGQSDHMRCLTVPGEAEALTAFIVAAPHENPGGYRGFLAANAPGQRDYQSGFNVDLGPGPTLRFEQLNVEGRGFGGALDLYQSGDRFGTLHIIEVDVNGEKGQVRLTLDGKPSGSRPFAPGRLSLDELTVGARYFTNGPGLQQVRGALRCDIAEIILYDRALSGEKAEAVRAYLNKKHANLALQLPQRLRLGEAGEPLVKAENPPAVQMLVPGFRVRELPLALTNLNNVRFREDGKLMTLGYNGDLHLLSDTDGDGLEDHAKLFWKNEGSLRGPIGLLLTPPDYHRGAGAFVPSKGKLSLIVDTDGDDKADEEIIVASGWQEIPQNVDAVGIAMDKDGALYFGLGTANYANAYLVDDSGKAAYDLASDRGTVQRVSPDFSRRETVCTGIRFPIAFAFNRDGDLFCTEQEGATWLANGNPFDEFLHIQTGRHYGFPPRHPRHNPNVIDEPSTFDYGPQHQSTCGFVFNEPVNGGPVFGPALWAGDAIVCGESRGKLWRTALIKTDRGYVADSQLFACLQMLTVDACVAPDGDLVVACHSGPPDWGTGPTGIGRLFRIEMIEADAPRPVNSWAESPNEIRIAFDKPLDPLAMRQLSERVRVGFGQYVRAGDRFVSLTPPYAVVQRQAMSPRYSLPVAGVSLTPDLRTMIISTAAMHANAHYAVTVPNKSASEVATDGLLRQHPQLDVDFSLNGLRAEWRADDPSDGGAWSGWLPHLAPDVARRLTAGSAQHDSLWSLLRQPGELTLRTRIDLHHILRPRVQPGSTIDYEWPPETVTVTISSSLPVAAKASSSPDLPHEVNAKVSEDGRQQLQFTVSGDTTDFVELEVKLTTSLDVTPEISVGVHTNEDPRPRPLPLKRFFLPWVKMREPDRDEQFQPQQIAELEGGSWGRGRRVFHSGEASCFKCHAIKGNGAKIGPDLANLIHRDYKSVLRDIVNPSYSINPDYIGQTVVLHSGMVLTGVLQSEGGQLLLGDEQGNVTRLDRAEIELMKLANVSVMPKGVPEKLSPQQLRDLMTFLLTKPPHMPLNSPLKAPPLRTQAELAAVLAAEPKTHESTRPLNMVLVAGKKDHGPGEHDYPAWQIQWGQLLASAPDVSVSLALEFPTEDQIGAADVLIFFQKGAWDDERARNMDKFFARGGGAVYIHWAVNGDERVAEFSKRIGLASRGGNIRYRHGPLTLNMHNTDHPIMRNFDSLQLYDESYWLLTGDPQDVTLLATSVEDGEPQPQLWTYEKGSGRVFVSIPGHYSWTFDDPLFRVLLLRGIAWTAKEPVDRFNELAPLGARIAR